MSGEAAPKLSATAAAAAAATKFRPGNQLNWQVEEEGLLKAKLRWGALKAWEHVPPPPVGTRIVFTPLVVSSKRAALAGLVTQQPVRGLCVTHPHQCGLVVVVCVYGGRVGRVVAQHHMCVEQNDAVKSAVPSVSKRGVARVLRRLSQQAAKHATRPTASGRESGAARRLHAVGQVTAGDYHNAGGSARSHGGSLTAPKRGDVTCVVAWTGPGPPVTPNVIELSDHTFGADGASRSPTPPVAASVGSSRGGSLSWVACGTTDGQVIVWNPMHEKPAVVVTMGRVGSTSIECMAYIPHLNLIVAGTHTGQLKLVFLQSSRYECSV